MAPRQNTFTVVPNPLGMQGLMSRAAVNENGGKPPMTSKQAQKLYRIATRQPRMSRAEQRRLEREEQERIRRAADKEKQAAKARMAREKKKAQEREALEDKRRKGLPLFDVHPSQDTISRFIRRNCAAGKRDADGRQQQQQKFTADLDTALEDDMGLETEERPAADGNDRNNHETEERSEAYCDQKNTDGHANKRQRTDLPSSTAQKSNDGTCGSGDDNACRRVPLFVTMDTIPFIAAQATPTADADANTCIDTQLPLQVAPDPQPSGQGSIAADGSIVANTMLTQQTTQSTTTSPNNLFARASGVVRSPPVKSGVICPPLDKQPITATTKQQPRQPQQPQRKQQQNHLPTRAPLRDVANQFLKPNTPFKDPAHSFLHGSRSTAPGPRGGSRTATPPLHLPPFKPAAGETVIASSLTERPRFLPDHLQAAAPPKTARPTPKQQQQRTSADDAALPTSTQLFVMSNIDDLFPSPSQEARELQADKVRSTPAWGRPPALPLKPAAAPMSAPPRPLMAQAACTSSTPSVSTAYTNDTKQTTSTEDADVSFPIFSTQDFVLSSQDIQELQEDTKTPSKLSSVCGTTFHHRHPGNKSLSSNATLLRSQFSARERLGSFASQSRNRGAPCFLDSSANKENENPNGSGHSSSSGSTQPSPTVRPQMQQPLSHTLRQETSKKMAHTRGRLHRVPAITQGSISGSGCGTVVPTSPSIAHADSAPKAAQPAMTREEPQDGMQRTTSQPPPQPSGKRFFTSSGTEERTYLAAEERKRRQHQEARTRELAPRRGGDRQRLKPAFEEDRGEGKDLPVASQESDYGDLDVDILLGLEKCW